MTDGIIQQVFKNLHIQHNKKSIDVVFGDHNYTRDEINKLQQELMEKIKQEADVYTSDSVRAGHEDAITLKKLIGDTESLKE